MARQFGEPTIGHAVFGHVEGYPEVYSVAKNRTANENREQMMVTPWSPGVLAQAPSRQLPAPAQIAHRLRDDRLRARFDGRWRADQATDLPQPRRLPAQRRPHPQAL